LFYVLVCTSLIANGERQEEDNVGGRIRMQSLSMLCQMNPVQALAIRAKCVCTNCFVCLFIWVSQVWSWKNLVCDWNSNTLV